MVHHITNIPQETMKTIDFVVKNFLNHCGSIDAGKTYNVIQTEIPFKGRYINPCHLRISILPQVSLALLCYQAFFYDCQIGNISVMPIRCIIKIRESIVEAGISIEGNVCFEIH